MKDLGSCNKWATTQQWLTVRTATVSSTAAFISGLEFYTVENKKIFAKTFDLHKWGGSPKPIRKTYIMSQLDITSEGEPCPKPETETCYTCCPVNCTYVKTPNSSCSATCGGGKRTKFTITQHAKCNGTACPENPLVDCNTQPCHCEVKWSNWSACSEECGPGTRTQTPIITGNPSKGGDPCPQQKEEECNERPCSSVSVAGALVGGNFFCRNMLSYLD